MNGPESFWDIALGPYLDLLGGYLWVILLFLAVGLVYWKTRSFVPTSFLWIIGSIFISPYVPGDVHVFFIFGATFGVVLVFYQLLVRKKYP